MVGGSASCHPTSIFMAMAEGIGSGPVATSLLPGRTAFRRPPGPSRTTASSPSSGEVIAAARSVFAVLGDVRRREEVQPGGRAPDADREARTGGALTGNALRDDVYRRPLGTALERLGVGAGWRCVDVGAGGGDVSVALAEIVGP